MRRRAVLILGTAAAGLIFLYSQQDPPDEVELICEANSLYKECMKTYHLASYDRWRAYVDSCREVWPSLDEPARIILLNALRAGKIMTEVERMVTWPHPKADPNSCGGTRFKTDDELDVEKEEYLKSGIRPLKDRLISVDEVPEAMQRGETAVFDARPIIPARMFNTSFQKLHELHREISASVPAWEGDGMRRTAGGRECSDWLHFFADEQFKAWGLRSWRAHLVRRFFMPWLLTRCFPPGKAPRSLQGMAQMSKNFHREDVPHSNFVNRTAQAVKVQARIRAKKKNNIIIGVTNINMNRLPNFSVDLGSKLFPGLVESTHSLLWMGQQRGGMHSDWQDNVIIQLSGDAEVVIFPSNCSAIALNLPNQVTVRDWASQGQPRGKVRSPFFHIHLKEGFGVTVPSMAWHKVTSKQSSRVAVNAFMEPKFGMMKWKSNPSNYFLNENRQNEAMRILWLKSMRHAWQTRGVHYFMHTDRNDYV